VLTVLTVAAGAYASFQAGRGIASIIQGVLRSSDADAAVGADGTLQVGTQTTTKNPCGGGNDPRWEFPEDPNNLTDILGVEPTKIGQTPDGTVRMEWEVGNMRIRYESHPEGLKPGDPGYNPRHHGGHYHVTGRIDSTKSFRNKGNTVKIEPPGYSKGDGTGFTPGECFPGKR
jgi:hypothetical protein